MKNVYTHTLNSIHVFIYNAQQSSKVEPIVSNCDRKIERDLSGFFFNSFQILLMKVKIITIIIERINQSIKQYPDYFEYYLNRSFYYLSLRKIDLAEADVTKAKELHYYENPAFEE